MSRGAEQPGEGPGPVHTPGPLESRLWAHSAVLFLIMIYSTAAVSENSLGRWLILGRHSVWDALECSLQM